MLEIIYENRTIEEVRECHCGLLENELFAEHFTLEQKKGLNVIITKTAA